MSLFICPLCQSPLLPAADTWRCDGSLNPKQTAHPFDVARQGYVNLLPVQQKKSKAPGDSADSIAARQRFLAARHYQPLQALICQQITQLLAQDKTEIESIKGHKPPINWLDIGCGEGYYTEAMAHCGMDSMIAADISKSAVIELAKQSKAAHHLWSQHRDEEESAAQSAVIYPLVTSAAHLPLAPQSIAGISSIFSPILPKAFAQVLEDKGCLVIAKPDVGHVASIREALFDSVREHDSAKFLTELAPYFELRATHHISAELRLSAADLADLLTMTPYSYRAQATKREALLQSAKMAPFHTEARFVVYVLQKIATAIL